MAALFNAVGTGDCRMVRELLNLPETQVDEVNTYRETPLLKAIHRKNIWIIEELLAHGANPNGPEMSSPPPLCRAVGEGCLQIVQMLIEAGANVNSHYNGHSALTMACKRYSDSSNIIAELLLDSGANIDITEDMNADPLHASVDCNAIKCVELLISRGADVNVLSGGRTPLFTAAKKGQSRCVELLLEAGADPNRTTSKGANALHYVAIDDPKSTLVVKSLIAAGIDVQNRYRGRTALQRISQSNSINNNKDSLYGDIQEENVHIMITDLIIAGDRSWDDVPAPCLGVEKALVAVYKNNPQDLAIFFKKLSPPVQEMIQNALIALHRHLEEEKLRIMVLAVILKAPGWDTLLAE